MQVGIGQEKVARDSLCKTARADLQAGNVARERTVVIVTHDDRAAGYGTRLVKLRDGKLA